MNYLIKKAESIVGIMDNEFFTRENPAPIHEAIKNRVDLYTKLGEVKEQDGTIHLLKEKSLKEPFLFSYLNFFADMSLYLFDTYLFVIMAVQEMCRYSHTIKENSIIDELHITIMDMYSENIIN
jgi:hypothetical protein